MEKKTDTSSSGLQEADGRDPNSYGGIFWCLGRYDPAWGPERPIFGKERHMSSVNTARKVKVKEYLAKEGVNLELPTYRASQFHTFAD